MTSELFKDPLLYCRVRLQIPGSYQLWLTALYQYLESNVKFALFVHNNKQTEISMVSVPEGSLAAGMAVINLLAAEKDSVRGLHLFLPQLP